ncbi:hypothetical protein [Dactylosporangium sp. NPDC051484]|uniref:alpha-amylase family glycosyl hydrolase n=1 Tax=Dactylosporangium sp. NPDC051484 TaxID=3154942 RepID=UPI00344DA4FF
MLGPGGSYLNFSGTGNTLSCNHPVVREFLLDCLRYWVSEYHVDGFRFDLASILGRAPDGTPLDNPPLLEAISADPVLRDTKLVAEAWDAAGLYQVGSFPHYGRRSEWNGRYRDAVRRFLRGDPHTLASINYVSSHDGFTLHDLFAYNEKHNVASARSCSRPDRSTHGRCASARRCPR